MIYVKFYNIRLAVIIAVSYTTYLTMGPTACAFYQTPIPWHKQIRLLTIAKNNNSNLRRMNLEAFSLYFVVLPTYFLVLNLELP